MGQEALALSVMDGPSPFPPWHAPVEVCTRLLLGQERLANAGPHMANLDYWGQLLAAFSVDPRPPALHDTPEHNPTISRIPIAGHRP